MNATDVTGPCTAVQYGLIMLACGRQKMEFRPDGKPIWWNPELQMVQLLKYWNWTVWQFSTDPYLWCLCVVVSL